MYRQPGYPAVYGVAATTLSYFCAATLSLWLTQGAAGLATIWPASGILLAGLLLAPKAMHGQILAGAGLANLTANLLCGYAPGMSMALSVVIMGEGWLACRLLRGQGERRPSFVQPRDIGRFLIVAVTVATAGACAASILTGLTGAAFTASWFLTDLLGTTIVTPMVLTGGSALRARGRHSDTPVRPRDVVLPLVLLATTTTAVFAQSRYPLLFLPLVALLAVTYRLGPFGAAGGVVLIAVIGTTLTLMGLGPLMLLRDGPAMTPLFLQFYLLVLMGTALPLAAMLATRNRLMRQVAESNRLLQMGERTARMGHWRLDMDTNALVWSPEILRLHGLDPGITPALETVIHTYHPEDRPRVQANIDAVLAGGDVGDFRFDARVLLADGTIRHVVLRGMADRLADGTLMGLFGVIQDVTERVEATQAMEVARKAAETAADTDQLTGIASRRAALRLLDAAMANATRSERPLSVAIFDVDHFKSVNDRYGHLAGDRVLQRVARAAVEASRHDDVIGRLGGEEFVLLLPGADADAAIAAAERVRVAIADSMASDGSDDPAVTISIGVAKLDADVSATMLLNRADHALYAAKSAGRNRIRMAA